MTVKSYHNHLPTASPVRARKDEAQRSEVLAKGPGDQHAITSVSVLFAHLMWLFIGPLALLLTLYGIVSIGGGWADCTECCVLRPCRFDGVVSLARSAFRARHDDQW